METYEPDNPVTEEEVYEPAPMWKRLAASLIDAIIIIALSLILAMIIGLLFGIYMSETLWDGIFFGSAFIIDTLYYSFMESSPYQASLGKLALNIFVINYDGHRISFWRSFARTLGKYVSTSFFYLGYLIGYITEYNQMLHDFIAKTYVVQKLSLPEGDIFDEKSLPGENYR